MTEEFTCQAVAYLLNELDPKGRATFEAALSRDAEAAAELKDVADLLAMHAAATSPVERRPTTEKEQMLAQILEGIAPRRRVIDDLKRYAWPLAAAVLLGFNVGQWIQHRRAIAHPVDMADNFAPPRHGRLLGGAGQDSSAVPVGLTNRGSQLAPANNSTAALPYIRHFVAFTVTQSTTFPANPVQRPPEKSPSPPQGSLELHNLPKPAENQRLYLWAEQVSGGAFEPVGEIPPQIYGASGTINYQLRPGSGPAAKFLITIEPAGPRIPSAPSKEIVCTGP